jgi:plasmid maintenance system antidote protein VapI
MTETRDEKHGPMKDRPPYRYKLRARLAERGYRTQRELAEAIGLRPDRISRVISGWEIPSPELARRMADRLGMTLEELRSLL